VRRLLLRALALFLALFLAGCAPKPPSGTLPVRLAVGGQGQLIYLSVTLAQELGFYNQAGLDVSLQDFPGGAKSLEALLGGSADVVCGFYDHAIQMAAQGQEIRAFVSILRYPGLVAVSGNSAVARIEDLKGKIVGVSAAGSSTQMFLNYLLVTHGLKPSDVSVASVSLGATAVAAVTRGRVDVAIMTDPGIDLVRKQLPSAAILADTRTAEGVRAIFGVDVYPSTVLYSTGTWLSAHPKEARALARALRQTVDWMRSHTPEEIRGRQPPRFRTEDAAADLEALRSMQAMLSPDGRLTPESAAMVRKVLDISLDSVRGATIDLARTYTNEFVQDPIK
jgi:NitT/TauT family transport system substrate-binding protein